MHVKVRTGMYWTSTLRITDPEGLKARLQKLYDMYNKEHERWMEECRELLVVKDTNTDAAEKFGILYGCAETAMFARIHFQELLDFFEEEAEEGVESVDEVSDII